MSERIRIGDEYWFQPPHNGLMGMVLDEDLDTIAYYDMPKDWYDAIQTLFQIEVMP